MAKCDDIFEILKNPERESLNIEWKQSAILRDVEELGCQIVAFANRYGGKLLIGIKNDGTFEGKGIFDIDRDKGIIDNICNTKISPIVEYTMEFLTCVDGDILVVNVPKRKGIPHAYIDSRKGPEIKNRTYYIRTEHGKRLVSDRQLEWLFRHQEDPDILFPFNIVITYLKDSFKIPYNIEQPACIRNYLTFVNSIPEGKISTLQKDWETIQSFFLEITPYALIQSLSFIFFHSWLIEIKRALETTSYIPKVKNVSSKKISISELPLPPKGSVIDSLGWNFKEILKSGGSPDFCLPPNSNLAIQFNDENGKKVRLLLEHDDFSFSLLFRRSSMGEGLHFSHPMRAVLMDNKTLEDGEKIHRLYQFIGIDCEFKATFNFPENDVEMFNQYYHFAGTIKDLLENDWDYVHFIKQLPNHKLYTIDEKLNYIKKKLH